MPSNSHNSKRTALMYNKCFSAVAPHLEFVVSGIYVHLENGHDIFLLNAISPHLCCDLESISHVFGLVDGKVDIQAYDIVIIIKQCIL